VALSDLFARRRKDEPDTSSPVHPTKALEKFVTGLSGRTEAVLVDLGPVVGSNVTFFQEEISCKIYLEDLPKDIDRHVAEGKLEELGTFFDTRFGYESGTIDGVLCWDIFDFLERPAAERLAKELKRVLRPDGLLLAFFSTADPRSDPRPTYTRHVIVDRTHLQYRTYAAARGKQRPLLNRDIQRLLEPLRITENILLKNNLREVLFRKPAAADTTAGPATPG
jgi:SAM-dependent methyltransferase